MKPLPGEVQNSQVDLKDVKNGKNSSCTQTTGEKFSFINNDQINTVVDILKRRLPRSAHVYNMAKMSSKFPSVAAYSLNGDLSEKAVFVFIDIRQDWNQTISVSVPSDFKISENVKQAFVNTSIIDWNEKYLFSAVDRLISPMLTEISTIHKGNSTLTNPNSYYYMDADEAANLDIKLRPGVEVKPLSLGVNGGMDFILKGWKYTREGTAEFLHEIVENGLSAGVFIDGVPVCGIIATRDGLLGMLYTAKDHRKKGYAQICTQYLMKQLGKNGYVTASACEFRNAASSEFHKKAGMTGVYLCDYILFEKNGFEAK